MEALIYTVFSYYAETRTENSIAYWNNTPGFLTLKPNVFGNEVQPVEALTIQGLKLQNSAFSKGHHVP